MKRPLLLLFLMVLWSQVSLAKEPNPSDFPINFEVKMTGQNEGYGANPFGGGAVPELFCWVHVSDGTTLYNAQTEKKGAIASSFGNCGPLSVGAHFQGRVSGDHRYLQLLIPAKKGKWKAVTYRITQMGDAKTVQ